MQNNYYSPPYKQNHRRHLKRRILFGFAFAAALIVGGYLLRNKDSSPDNNQAAQTTKPASGPSPEPKPTEPVLETLPSVQVLVDSWVSKNSGVYSIVIYDLADGKELASYQSNKSYFTASIYKLYVAYLGYLDIQNGKHALSDPFLGSWNRQQCLDKMIRESHSPCAEKLWAEQGKEASTKRLKEMGFSGTSMVGLTTTARDSNTLLVRLYQKKDLNAKHTALLLDSMKKQIYRDAIPKALPNLAVWDKVGFRELVEYHDVGIVTLPDKRQVAISIFTQNAGTRRIIDLTKTIFQPLIAVTD